MIKDLLSDKKILVVFNMFDNPSKSNIRVWKENIIKLLVQKNVRYDLVLSLSMGRDHIIKDLIKFLGAVIHRCESIYLNVTHEALPVNTSFNHTCMQATQKSGENYDGYLYCASDINMPNTQVISQIAYAHVNNNSAITHGMVNNDDGLDHWFGDTERQQIFCKLQDNDFSIPIGKTMNLHCAMFDKSIFNAFGKLMPDIFASTSTESVFYYICVSLNKKYYICSTKDFILSHQGMLDGRSHCFKTEYTHEKSWKHMFRAKLGARQKFFSKEAKAVGIGYEEIHGIVPHDKTKFDSEGMPIDSQALRKYIKYNLYLGSDELNYDAIGHDFMEIS